ncbi:VOC family protein [Nonomuraea turkmeniaca]|uniref:VOC family protein n=1 Tax=Nonomuraea turkmeniaca TaxID=103838 RepID=A0A5S4FQD1_9ACTN|nr:VOC family protein [Nonomuraea turkmeniaca]TMR22789.1 VOC family protein [Nonomuraea turkmeniaca]
MGHDVSGLHHVGHIVHDMGQALERYRRMGFALPGPAYPVVGEPPEPVGVGNTHAYFAGNFVELVAVAGAGRVPADARLIPLRAPAERLPALKEAVRGTAANLEACLRRFEGVHILMFDSPGIDGAAARLAASGVGHGGVQAAQRPVETADGVRMEPVRWLEIDGVGPGLVPEGRVGLAENTSAHDTAGHPNGAVELVECVLCVADDELDAAEQRYQRYVGRTASRDGAVRTFTLGEGRGRITLVGASGLDGLLPGEGATALPGFAAYAVAVRDVAATGRFLREAGVPVAKTDAGEIFVPAREALGTAILFRQVG